MKTPASRKPFNFPDSIKHRVNAYAIAAGAAASLLTTAQPAQAEVIFTPINMTLQNGQLSLDVDGDGIVDFVLNDELRITTFSGNRVLWVQPRSAGDIQNAVVGCASACSNAPEARPLQAADFVGPNRQFVTGHVRLVSVEQYYSAGAYCIGLFRGYNMFLGLKFQINSETHYGWVSFRAVGCSVIGRHYGSIYAMINGMAYETVPNQPIKAGDKGPSAAVASPSSEITGPQPASLGVLALGAPGLSIWRRE